MEVWKERGEKGFVMISSQSLPSVFSRDSMKVVGLPIFADMGEAILIIIALARRLSSWPHQKFLAQIFACMIYSLMKYEGLAIIYAMAWSR